MFRGRLISPYQHTGVKWMVEREHAQSLKGGFLCDEMGLGKTVQVIATMLSNPGHVTLIVVPKSIVYQWKHEIAKFAPSLTVHVYDGAKFLVKQQVVAICFINCSQVPNAH